MAGHGEFLASISRSNNGEIIFTRIPFSEINNFSRAMPDHWIKKGEFDVTDEYISYVESLIGTPLAHRFKNIFDVNFTDTMQNVKKILRK